MQKAEKIERLAMTGCKLPAGYPQPEQLLFLSLRALHWEYRHGVIDRAQAKEEKQLLTEEYEAEIRMYEIFRQHVEIRNTLSHRLTAAEKNGCSHCRELVQIFDGRKKGEKNDVSGTIKALRTGKAGTDEQRDLCFGVRAQDH